MSGRERTLAEQAMVEAAHMRLKRIYPRGGPSDVGLMVAEVEHLREKLAAAERDAERLEAALEGACIYLEAQGHRPQANHFRAALAARAQAPGGES